MSKTWTRTEIIQCIKQDLLLDRLQLGSSGVALSDIGDDTPLLDGGLGLDSVDVLDLLVSAERTFGFKAPDPDRVFLEQTCRSVSTLTDFVMSKLDSTTVQAHAG